MPEFGKNVHGVTEDVPRIKESMHRVSGSMPLMEQDMPFTDVKCLKGARK